MIVPPAYNRFTNSFSHIFGGGYAAGYYSYKWAEVLAADSFAAFEEAGHFDRTTAQKCRSSILAVGGIKETPAIVNGKLSRSHIMKVSLSCDHRVVDGVAGAKFLQTFKGFLVNPVVLLGQNSI